MSEKPYREKTITVRLFNPDYDPENKKKCECGHMYERHFDTCDYNRDDPDAVCGCKYCGCNDFKLAN